MKPLLMYVIIFFGSLLVVLVLTAVAVTTKPDLFTSGPRAVSKDSTVAHAHKDSVKTHPADSTPVVQSQSPKDTSHVAGASIPNLADSVKSLSMQLDAERSKVDELNKKLQASTTHVDSLKARETKTMAKLFESMKAEDAARILGNFSDAEAKELITAVKKRQAGKILGLLSAERAARIMR